VFSVVNAQAGTYFLQINTSNGVGDFSAGSQGSNSFGLRSYFGGSFSECSTDPATAGTHDLTCPAISAVGWAGLLANLGGTYPTFGVGALEPMDAGGLLQVDVWDPGEGMVGLELLDPLGRSGDFDWLVVDRSGSDAVPTGGWSGTVVQLGGMPCAAHPDECSALDLVGTPNTVFAPSSPSYWRGWNPQPGPYRGSRSKYSDRLLELTVPLPADLVAEYGGASGVRVRYQAGLVFGAPTDRTMWRAGVWEIGAAP
jgi:hypothetical protein